MNPLFPDKIWNYKNFNMGTELDISGEFIFDGINVLNQMKYDYPKETMLSLMNFTSTHDISRAINIFGADEFNKMKAVAEDCKKEFFYSEIAKRALELD